VATANTSPTIKGNSLDQTQWINEVAMWSEVPIFTPVELQNLYDLGNVFGDTLDQYEENYGPPLCWQATAMMPDGSVWRDAGTGLCPQIIRVPNGAVDIIVTDGGRQVTPIIRES
jgi:hypothetical protein